MNYYSYYYFQLTNTVDYFAGEEYLLISLVSCYYRYFIRRSTINYFFIEFYRHYYSCNWKIRNKGHLTDPLKSHITKSMALALYMTIVFVIYEYENLRIEGNSLVASG
jgi:hypothetical protein